MTRQDPQKMAAWLSKRERNGWSWAELSRRSGLPSWKLRWWHERLKKNPLPRSPVHPFVAVEIDRAQLSMLLEGIDWKSAKRASHYTRAFDIKSHYRPV